MYFGKVKGSLLYTKTNLFYRNKKLSYDHCQTCVTSQFTRHNAFIVFFLLNSFNLGLRTITSLYTQKVEISNVCVLLCIYNAYGEQVMVYGLPLIKWQQH